MKKIYVNPSIKKIQINDTPILAGSLPVSDEKGGSDYTEEATKEERLGKKYNTNLWGE